MNILDLTPHRLPPRRGYRWKVSEVEVLGDKFITLSLVGGKGKRFNRYYEVAVVALAEFEVIIRMAMFDQSPQDVLDSLAEDLLETEWY